MWEYPKPTHFCRKREASSGIKVPGGHGDAMEGANRRKRSAAFPITFSEDALPAMSGLVYRKR
jgi:hypothetical protein